MKKTLLILSLLIALPAQAGSVAGTGGSLETTQYLNYGELFVQTNTVMSSLQTQMQQLSNLQQQVASGQILNWGQAKQVISNVASTINQAKGIGYDSQVMAGRWSSLYPDFNTRSGSNYMQQYGNWSKETNNAIKTALTVNGLQVKDYQTDAATRASLEQLSNDANGSQSQIAAVNATNQIAMGQYDEMQKLRQIQVAQNGAMLTYMQGQQQASDTKAAQDDTLRKMFSKPAEMRTYDQQLQLNK